MHCPSEMTPEQLRYRGSLVCRPVPKTGAQVHLQLMSTQSRHSLNVVHFGDIIRTTFGRSTGPEMRFVLTEPGTHTSRRAVTTRDRLCLTPWTHDNRANQPQHAVTFEIQSYHPPTVFDPTTRCGLQTHSGQSLGTSGVDVLTQTGPPEPIFLFEPHSSGGLNQLNYGDEVCLRVGASGVLTTGPRGEVRVDDDPRSPHRWQLLDPECPSSRTPLGCDAAIALLSHEGTFLSVPGSSEICAVRLAIGPHEVLRISSPKPRESRTKVH